MDFVISHYNTIQYLAYGLVLLGIVFLCVKRHPVYMFLVVIPLLGWLAISSATEKRFTEKTFNSGKVTYKGDTYSVSGCDLNKNTLSLVDKDHRVFVVRSSDVLTQQEK